MTWIGTDEQVDQAIKAAIDAHRTLGDRPEKILYRCLRLVRGPRYAARAVGVSLIGQDNYEDLEERWGGDPLERIVREGIAYAERVIRCEGDDEDRDALDSLLADEADAAVVARQTIEMALSYEPERHPDYGTVDDDTVDEFWGTMRAALSFLRSPHEPNIAATLRGWDVGIIEALADQGDQP